MSYLFSSESVSEGHPDKIADQISDAILDNFLAQDPESKVACETLVTTGLVIISGEVTSKAYVDVEAVARNTIKNIGYNKSEYKLLVEHLSSMVHEIFRDYGLEMPFFLGNMWANINYPGAYNKHHVHPNSTWSGAYYIKVPKDAGCIWVEDPRPGPNILMPRRLNNLPRALWRVVQYPPVEGQCIMFPAWVPHGVEVNESKEKGEKGWRVSVSFNFIQGNCP